jgi:hypothetical protein
MLRRTPLLLVLAAGLVAGVSAPASAGSSDDEEIAESSILTEDDVADFGLFETDPSDQPPPSASACRKVRAARRAANRRPRAESAFEDEAGNEANSEVIIYKTERAARQPITAFSTGTAEDCISRNLEDSLEQNLPEGASAEFSGERVEVPLGDENVVYQIVITVTADDGSTQELYGELGFIRVGRGVAALDFLGVGEPFPGSEDLATIVTDRLTEALEAA